MPGPHAAAYIFNYTSATLRISVIIPTLNEESSIASALDSIRFEAERVVVDGASRDRTVERACARGARVVHSPRGRARQMNAGAEASSGEVLLFLHADCELPPGADDAIRRALVPADVAGGSFRMEIASPRRALRLLAWGANLRARWLRLPYGDQALFVRRSAFLAVGGFREIPVMEDVDLVRRLRRRGRLVCLALPVKTSPRHWEHRGPFVSTVINWGAVLLFSLGVSAGWLSPRYHRLRGAAARELFF